MEIVLRQSRQQLNVELSCVRQRGRGQLIRSTFVVCHGQIFKFLG